MINKLRFKFIKITSASVLAVLLVIIATVNLVNVIQNNRSLDMVTDTLLRNGGTFKKLEEPFDEAGKGFNNPGDEFRKEDGGGKLDDRFHNKEELPFSSRFFWVSFTDEMEIEEYNLDHIASVGAEEVEGIADTILSKNQSVGWYKSYRYRVGTYQGQTFLVVLESTATKSSVLTVLTITLVVGLGSFLVVFLLVALFSKRAIGPIAETYEKQRQFITDASHELKTPLTVISANAEILKLTYGENEWCEGIERQTHSMRSLVGQMIQMSKLDEDRGELVSEPFNISDAVYDTALSFEPLTQKKGLHLDTDISPNLTMKGDEGAVRQVLSILMDNGVKYCDPEGRIHVSLAKERSLGKERLVISVRNTYQEVASLDHRKIFERFYRDDKARTDTHSYGLGLSIAKAIVEKCGGTISCVKGQGEIEMRIQL